MTELDLGLKCGVRRLLWNMGYSTRIDVELRGSRPGGTTGQRGAPESFTDLDVLGIRATIESGLSTVIADCKSGRRDRPTARLFWLKGVSSFFDADRAMLVRENSVNDGARQLASRLGIAVLTPDDLQRMQSLHPDDYEEVGPIGLLFDRFQVAGHLSAYNSLDAKLSELLEFLQFDYWVYEQHRNLTQVVAHLAEASKRLDPRNPIHVALIIDLAWEYTLTIVSAIEYIRGAFLLDPDRGLQEFMFGGAIELREKQDTARALRALVPDSVDRPDYLPGYYSNLRELVVRFMRRPAQVQTSLRYNELACAFAVARKRVTIEEAFGPLFDPVAAKLAADVVGFLVAAADLDPGFRGRARAYLLAEPISANEQGGSSGAASRMATEPTLLDLAADEEPS